MLANQAFTCTRAGGWLTWTCVANAHEGPNAALASRCLRQAAETTGSMAVD